MNAEKPSTPQAVQACHRLVLWIIPLLDQFPRQRRFTLGDRIETILLGVLEDLVSAAYSGAQQKHVALKHANLKLEETSSINLRLRLKLEVL